MSEVAEASPKYLAEMASNAIPSGYKQTEVGVIPADWDAVCLGDVSEVRMCKRILAGQTKKIGAIPFFKIGTFGGEPDAYISQFLYEDFKAKYSFPDKGDILISAAGTLGKSVIYDGRPAYFQDSNIVWLKLNQRKLLNEYLYHYYKVIKWASSEGSTIARLYNGIIRASMIAFPATLEQTAIANALSDVDGLIQELEKLIAKKQAIKTATMQQLLTGRTRLPQFAYRGDGSKKGYKQSELGEIPEDWEVRETNDFSAFITKGSTPTTYGFNWEKDGVVFLRSECVSDSGLDLSESMFISEEANSVLSRSEVKAGDILVTITGNVGRVIFLDEQLDKANINQHIARIRVCDSRVVGKYVYHYLSQSEIRRDLNKITTGQAYPQLSLEQVRDLKVILPIYSEQLAISTLLSDMDKEIEVLTLRLNKTRQIKQGMMQELLTGRTRLVKPESA